MYIFSNILGVFVFDGNINLVDRLLFDGTEDYENKKKLIESIKKKHKNAENADGEPLRKIIHYFRNKEFLSEFYAKNLQITKHDIKNSVNEDSLIMQSIGSVESIEQSISILVKRLREWYELHNPEFSLATKSHELFVESILDKGKDELLNGLKINPADSIGADFEQENLEPIRSLAHQVYDLYCLKASQMSYISSLMDMFCPNIKAVCGPLVAARLIEHAGSLKRLSEMPASTIQILGAETALFRHLKTGAKPPRHGIIVHHPLIAKAPDRMHGKVARALADKISIAAKVDYFHGKLIGDKLRDELDKKFNVKH